MNQPTTLKFLSGCIPWHPFEMVTLTPDLPSYFPDSPPGIDCMRVTQDAIWRAMEARGTVFRQNGLTWFVKLSPTQNKKRPGTC